MDSTNSELFGHLVYAEDLTYEELLDIEDHLTQQITNLLERAEAEFLDFTPMGDALMFQCEFTTHKLYIFRKIACELVDLLPEGVTGRLLYLSHALENYTLYWVAPKQWQEQNAHIPLEAPKDLRAWKTAAPQSL